MSFILKALKKLEQEKAEQPPGPANLERAILSGGKTVESIPRLFRWGVIVITFVAGVGLTYLLMHTDHGKSTGSHNQPVVADVPAASLAAVAASTPRPSAVGVSSELPAAPREETLRPLDVPPVPPHRQEPADARSHTRHKSAANVPLASPPSQEVAVSPPSGIKVNGIAVQDDPGESVAVINGALIKKGMSVSGAKVEEIYPDRVKFSGSGGVFQVPLSK